MPDNDVVIAIKLASTDAKSRIVETSQRLSAIGSAARAQSPELDALARRLEALRGAAKLDYARGLLGVKPFADVNREINQAQLAFGRLRASGTLSAAELGQAYARLQFRIAELRGQTNGWAAGIEQMRGAFASLRVGIGAFALAAREAIAFETALVAVQRAANISREEATALGRELQRVSRSLATPAADIAALATEGAKMGIAREELARFAEIATVAARNFDIIPAEAGEALGKLKNILRIPRAETDAFVGAINAMADQAAARGRGKRQSGLFRPVPQRLQ